MLRAILLSCVVLLGGLGLAQAETMGYADAIRLLERSCGKDIQRYCANAQLANFGIGHCLEENAAKLSAQCNQDRVTVRQSIQARTDAQAAVPELCRNDMRRLCPTIVRGRGYTLQCLLKAERSVSKRCNQAITNAGWR